MQVPRTFTFETFGIVFSASRPIHGINFIKELALQNRMTEFDICHSNGREIYWKNVRVRVYPLTYRIDLFTHNSDYSDSLILCIPPHSSELLKFSLYQSSYSGPPPDFYTCTIVY